MWIWNGLRGGVYRFPSGKPMSIERRLGESTEEYYRRYQNEVDKLVEYPNSFEAYDGASKDRGAYRLNGQVVRREFAIDIRRVDRKYLPRNLPAETPKRSFKPRERRAETIFVTDLPRNTEESIMEDLHDGHTGGITGVSNAVMRNIPTIDTTRLYQKSGLYEAPDPFLVPEEKELELRSVRMDTIFPDVATHFPEKRPFQYNEFDGEYEKDVHDWADYFVVNTDPRPLKINGKFLLMQGEVAGPLPTFAWFEAPGGQVGFWFGRGGSFYKPVPKVATALRDIVTRYANDPNFRPSLRGSKESRGSRGRGRDRGRGRGRGTVS